MPVTETTVAALISRMALLPPPLTARLLAPGPEMVRFLEAVMAPVVSVMVEHAGVIAKETVSPDEASAIA